MSKLLFLGTGAADWNMKTDVNLDGFRGLTSILLDDHIMIDISCGAYLYADRTGKKDILKKVDTVFITHSHIDHYDKNQLERLCKENEHNITVYADKELESLMPDCGNLIFNKMDALINESVNIDGYKVTALRSNHATPNPYEQTRHYYFEGDKNFLFGFDGGWLVTATWDFLLKHPIDLYIIDSTCGEKHALDFRNFSHNNADMIDIIVQTCKANGVMNENSKVILTHLAKTLHPSHNEIVSINKNKGYIVAYDGMEYKL